MPAPGYAVGFLRTYCAFLELPSERFVDDFRAYARAAGRTVRPIQTARRPRPSWKDEVIAWAAICAVLLLGWVTYAAIVRPQADVSENRVEAGTREMVIRHPSQTLSFDEAIDL